MYLEARPESWLEDKKGEFRLAYKEHATARPNQNMLYCAGALFDAMQPWRDWDCLDRPRCHEGSRYLQGSGHPFVKRGLSRGAANAFQMFHETEHRLAFPFSESLKNLQCTVDGKTLHSRRQEYSTDAVLGGTYLETTNGHDDGAKPADYRGPFG